MERWSNGTGYCQRWYQLEVGWSEKWQEETMLTVGPRILRTLGMLQLLLHMKGTLYKKSWVLPVFAIMKNTIIVRDDRLPLSWSIVIISLFTRSRSSLWVVLTATYVQFSNDSMTRTLFLLPLPSSPLSGYLRKPEPGAQGKLRSGTRV